MNYKIKKFTEKNIYHGFLSFFGKKFFTLCVFRLKNFIFVSIQE